MVYAYSLPFQLSDLLGDEGGGAVKISGKMLNWEGFVCQIDLTEQLILEVGQAQLGRVKLLGLNLAKVEVYNIPDMLSCIH